MLRILIIFTLCLHVSISSLVVADEQTDRSDPKPEYLKRFTVPEDDPCGNTEVIGDLTFSPDGKMLAVAYGRFIGLLQEPRPGQTIIWDVNSGKRIKTFKNHKDGVSGVDFSSDGKFFASSGYGGKVQIWGLPGWHQQAQIKIPQGVATSLDISPDSSLLAVGTLQGKKDPLKNTINLYQAATGKQISALRGHTDGVPGVRFSPDGKMLVSSATDETVRVWNIKNRTNKIISKADETWFWTVDFSPDGKLVATGGNDLGRGKWRIQVWDTKSWKLKHHLFGKKDAYSLIRSVKFSPNNKWLASASSDSTARLFNLSNTKLINLSQPAYQIAFSPDGKSIALAYDKVVTLWSLEKLIDKSKNEKNNR